MSFTKAAASWTLSLIRVVMALMRASGFTGAEESDVEDVAEEEEVVDDLPCLGLLFVEEEGGGVESAIKEWAAALTW